MKSPFELGMLICFGISWPFAIWKTIRTRQTAGKSPAFLSIVALSYVFGILHKINPKYYDWVVWCYALNLAMVLTDLGLYAFFTLRKKRAQRAAA